MNQRLNAALRKMKRGSKFQGKDGFDVAIRRQAVVEKDFWEKVEWVKFELPSLPPSRVLTDATPLRLTLEQHPVLKLELRQEFTTPYFAKTMLAVALVELGFKVSFTSPDYFDSDYPTKKAMRYLPDGNRR